MSNWKQAFWLMKFEFKQSPFVLFIQIGILIIVLLLIVPIIPEYLKDPSMGVDFLFLLIFTILSQWARPSIFREQKLGNGWYASYFLITLNSLPIQKEIIVKYRFLTYLILSISFQVMFFIAIYLLAPYLQIEFRLSTYIVFALIWICFSIYFGGLQPVTEAGANLVIHILTSLLVLGPILFVSILFLFYTWYERGFVNWTLFIAENYPIPAIILSLLFAVIGWKFWMLRMNRKMNRMDYL